MVMIQRFVGLLRARDTQAVGRLLGATERPAGAERLEERMREANFTARLTGMGQLDTTTGADVVTLPFQVEVSWRSAVGAREQRTLQFLAAIRPSPDGWALAGVTRRQG